MIPSLCRCIWPVRLPCWAALLSIAGLTLLSDANAQDGRRFPVDSDVEIRINWQSFVDTGFASSIEIPLRESVVNAYTRWLHVGGMRIRPRYMGYTTSTTPASNEIIVSANRQHSGWRSDATGAACTPNPATSVGDACNWPTGRVDAAGCRCGDCCRLASTFGSLIVIHQRNARDGTIYPYQFWHTDVAGEFDGVGVLLHELGHAFGLGHEPTIDSIMFGANTWWAAYGPNSKDVQDIVALYGKRDSLRFRIRRSADGGLTWGPVASNLSRIGATTTLPFSVSRDPARSIVFYTNQDHRPSWIIGNSAATEFATTRWWTFGGQPSKYGTTGHGYDDQYMMSWVDYGADEDAVKVVRSTDGGLTWQWRNPPLSKSTGTPAVHKLADDTWVLAYSKLSDRAAGSSDTGRIMVRLTTNGGVSWGPEVELDSLYRAENGVSITSNGPSEIRIGFSWSDSSVRNLKRTIVAHLEGPEIVKDRVIVVVSEPSRTPFSMTRTSGFFIKAWRGTNFLTSINTRNSPSGSTRWSNHVVLDSSLVNPAVAAHRGWSDAHLYTLE